MYQFNNIYDKGVGLQFRKLSYNPPPVQIKNNQVDMAIQLELTTERLLVRLAAHCLETLTYFKFYLRF